MSDTGWKRAEDPRWQRIEEIFHDAIELPASQRAAFLSAACAGDDQLRREVDTLLAHDDSSGNLVEAAVNEAVEQLPAEPGADSGLRSDQLIGKHIGVFHITELIGKGGMGMVFKARDTQLNRTVAIKALPLDSHSGLEARRRFVQEAKATSALNHPNIVTVHSIIHEGGQESGTDFMVMEYVAGQTLDQAIPAKGLPVERALKYGIEIADALAAAHAAGIVHRDVKPSNIMVTAEGRIKVLDFGLAKLTESSAANPAETKTGLVFGTASYISPEQAQGKRADARSDIFAFGAVLYEMVTGRRAFAGDDVITILAAVLHDSTPSIRMAAAGAPPELEWIISRCMKKDPERRIQHMVEVKLALREVLENLGSLTESPVAARSRRRMWLLAPALIGLTAAALVFAAWLGPRIFQRQPITFQRLTFQRGDVITARFAPGGSVVYAAEWDGAPPTLFLAQPGSREARDLGLPPANILSVSPQSEMALLLGSGEPNTVGTLASVPLSGGAPRDILENVAFGDWRPDGKALAVVRSVEGHHRVEYPIGNVLYQTESLRPPLYLRVSPQGDAVAFFDYSEFGDYSLNVIRPPHPRQVLSRGWRTIAGIAWSPSGKEIWFSGGRPSDAPALYSVDLSGRERLLTQIPGWGSLYDVARDGQLLLANVDSRIGLQCLSPSAKDERDLAWLDASQVFDMSQDGNWILFGELSAGEGRNPALYLRRTTGGPAVKLGYGGRAALSGDGKRVVCIRQDGNNSQLMVVPTGAGESLILPTPGIRPESVEWFPDGKRLLFTGFEADRLPRTYILDLAGGKARLVTSAAVRASSISPDGRTTVTIKLGRLVLHSLDSGAETPSGVVEPGDSVIRWSGDGRYLFVQHDDNDRRGIAIRRVEAHGGQEETWRKLKPLDATAIFLSKVRLSADGQAYAVSFQRDLATLYIVRGVK